MVHEKEPLKRLFCYIDYTYNVYIVLFYVTDEAHHSDIVLIVDSN